MAGRMGCGDDGAVHIFRIDTLYYTVIVIGTRFRNFILFNFRQNVQNYRYR